MKLILASASPRRSELLSQAGLEFEVCPSTIEEIMTGDTPGDIVMSLACQKARDVFSHKTAGTGTCQGSEDAREQGILVLGADTIVVCDGKRLGKPKSAGDAYDMLMLLQDRSHEVYTGVCMITQKAGETIEHKFFERTTVTMYPITDAQARWYIATGEPMDKAGAYGIQGKGAVFIRGIEGDYNNVVGLPLASVWHYLKDNDFD